MNTIDIFPSRESISELNRTSWGEYELGGLTASWNLWLSDLLKTVNEMQATGTTAQRPNPAPFIGFTYFDTTLGKPIWAVTTTTWVDATGAAA